MPAKQILFPGIECDAEKLESLLSVLATRNYLSRNQLKAITTACAPLLPCVIEIAQRMPKGTTYISVNNAPMFEINNRSKINYIYS